MKSGSRGWWCVGEEQQRRQQQQSWWSSRKEQLLRCVQLPGTHQMRDARSGDRVLVAVFLMRRELRVSRGVAWPSLHNSHMHTMRRGEGDQPPSRVPGATHTGGRALGAELQQAVWQVHSGAVRGAGRRWRLPAVGP